MLDELIRANYPLKIKKLTLMDSHFGTEIFLLEADNGKYIVKTLPLFIDGAENEGHITEYLLSNGIKTARLMKTNEGKYLVKTNDMQFHIQDFIEGETLQMNTAPDWFMEKSADMLGRIHSVLKNYGDLKINFGGDFFNAGTVNGALNHYSCMLENSENDIVLMKELEERIRHLKRISNFKIDTSKLTYANSHGDYHIGQIITGNRELTVIDWTSACRLPAVLEVITSYAYADPKCKYGEINSEGLLKYIDCYSKHAALNEYDLEMMPYIFYFQQIICHYPPPYSAVADSYKPICGLINNLANRLNIMVAYPKEKGHYSFNR